MTKAEREKQHRRVVAISRLKLVLIVVCLIAIPVTFWANHRENASTHTEVNEIQKLVETPCETYGPKSRQCEEAFEAAVASINHREACFVMAKAGLHPGSCDGSRLRVPETKPEATGAGETTAPSRASAAPEGGDASTSSTGHSQSGPRGGGGATDQPSHPHGPSVADQSPGAGAEPTAAEPSSSSTPSTSEPSSSPSPESAAESPLAEAPHEVAEAPKAPVREGVGAALEGVGHLVEETGSTVTETTCTLAKLLCHE